MFDFLKGFFSYEDFGHTFYEFSLQHLAATIIFAVLPVLFVILLAKRIRGSGADKSLAILAGVIGLALEFTQYYWHYYGGQTDWRHIYPTTLCGLTIYLSSIAMITGNRTLGSVIYFFSHGAFFSFLLPQLSFGYDRFRFYAYFVIHGLIFFNAAYLLLVRGIKADKKAMITSGIILLPVLVLSVVFNHLFSDPDLSVAGSIRMNFFYLDHPPFEFPVYSWLYGIHRYLYTASVIISYYLLLLIMRGISWLLKLDGRKP